MSLALMRCATFRCRICARPTWVHPDNPAYAPCVSMRECPQCFAAMERRTREGCEPEERHSGRTIAVALLVAAVVGIVLVLHGL